MAAKLSDRAMQVLLALQDGYTLEEQQISGPRTAMIRATKAHSASIVLQPSFLGQLLTTGYIQAGTRHIQGVVIITPYTLTDAGRAVLDKQG